MSRRRAHGAPIHLVFAATATAGRGCSPARWSWWKKGRAPCCRKPRGDAARDYQSNTALELAIADEAHVDHIKITREARNALHVSSRWRM